MAFVTAKSISKYDVLCLKLFLWLKPSKPSHQKTFVRIFHIVGARLNFMRVAPVLNALKERTNVLQTFAASICRQ